MALTRGSAATSSDITSLKNKIKAEMQRRRYNTNMNVAANTGNFSQSAAQGQPIRISQFNETVGLLNKIKSQGISGSQNNLIYALNAALTNVNTYAGRAIDSSTNDCSSNCNGLCVGCQNTCRGSCSGGCTGNCGQSCNRGCNATCSGVHSMCSGCADGCMSGCSGYCYTSSFNSA